ncbi:Blue-light-activated protein [Planctomycetes bacterium Pan216]|uniref:histidine kinase n=1 Tax=Kolteria novifilia TaxID=2527975 RepID=A0A518AXK9_9BACT|nr:Blue-light-activated protein [Planctomycetes bacterium Pan216]
MTSHSPNENHDQTRRPQSVAPSTSTGNVAKKIGDGACPDVENLDQLRANSDLLPFLHRRGGSYEPGTSPFRATAILIAAGLFLTALLADYATTQQFATSIRAEVQEELTKARTRLESCLQGNIQLMRGLPGIIAILPDVTQEQFAKAVKPLFQGDSQLRHIAVAPDLIVEIFYPIEGNEVIMGLDHRETASHFEAIDFARRTRQLVLAGPIELVQGGTGFIGRIPVFLPDADGKEQFWGVISAVVGKEALIRESGLRNELPINIAIRSVEGIGSHGEVFFGDEAIFKDNPVVAEVPLPYGSWTMAAVPRDGWPAYPGRIWLQRVGFLLAASLILGSTFLVSRARDRLHDAAKRTQVAEIFARGVIDSLSARIAAIGDDGTILAVNRAWREFHSVDDSRPSSFVEGVNYFEVRDDAMKEADAQACEDGVRAVLDGQTDFVEIEYALGRHDDHRWFVCRVTPFPSGGSAKAVVAHEDVTQRRSAEEALRESETHLRAIVESEPECVKLMDRQGKVLDMNPAGLRMLGIESLEDVLGKSAYDIVEREHHAEFRKGIEAVFRGEKTFQTFEIRSNDGTRRWLEQHAVPLWHPEHPDQVKSMLAVARDITQRKKTEEEVRALQTQMLHAQKMESLGILAGGVAHDFNNILTAILGYANLLVDEPTISRDNRDMLVRIGESAERAAELCSQLLSYSGRGSFVIKPVDLSSLVCETEQMIHVSLSKKTAVHFKLGENLPKVEADEVQLRQVIMNLVTNASDAIGDEVGELTIETGRAPYDSFDCESNLAGGTCEPGTYVYAKVTDTGCGMSPSTLEKMFDPFFTTKPTGRGLGMAAVLGVIRGHHGLITCDTTPGLGTTFTVAFPQMSGAPHEPTLPRSSAPSRESTHHGTALVIDDESFIRSILKQALESRGFEVLLAVDGQHGIETFAAHADDIVLSLIDMSMPRLGGLETMRFIRQIQPSAQVVLMSGFTKEDVVEGEDGDAPDGYIKKPFRLEDLFRVVTGVLEGSAERV